MVLGTKLIFLKFINKTTYLMYKIKLLIVTTVACLCSMMLHAQNSVTGNISDIYGETVIGASILEKGTTNGTVSDIDGNFTLDVPIGSTIQISYIGYITQEIKITGGSLEIILEEDTQTLDEVTVVAYGAQKKVTVTGAISQLSGSDLVKTPTGSIGNALAGKLPGVSTVQYSGEPGADAADIYIRGITTLNSSSPLVQVDGVERDFTQIDPNEIESITILKDASATAVFGVRGANGVILVTTKRGKEGKAKITASTSTGVTVPTRLLEFANSYQYASFYNEAQIRDGVNPASVKFNEEMLNAFKTNSDPLLYPDMDWLDYTMKSYAPQSQHNVNISGGNNFFRYFVSAGIYTQGGLFKTFDTGYDFNFDFKRYNYRANLDFDLSKTTELSVNIGGRVEDKNAPISTEDQNQLFRHMYWATPFSGAGIVDGKWIKTNPDLIPSVGVDGLNPYFGRGYNNRVGNTLNVDVQVKQDLDFIAPGLDLNVKGSYNSDYTQTKSRSSSKAYYVAIKNDDGSLGYRKYGEDGTLGYGESFGKGRNWYFESSLSYNTTINNDHNLGGLLLYNQSKYYYPGTFTDLPKGYVGLVGRATYDYRSKYMAEVNIGYNGSENFAPGKRYGLFPAGSIGWVVTEEPFMEDLKQYVNYLKVRASYGIVGNDNTQNRRFMYIDDPYYLNGSGYNFGTNVGSNQGGAYEGAKSNPDVTWEKAYKQNVGIDLYVLNDRLKTTFDFFREHRTDILVVPNSLPSYIGMSLPVLNNGVVDSHGYEITLNWTDRVGKGFRYWISPNISFARNKIVEQMEVRPNEDYLWKTGKPVNQPFGRKFWGFYDANANERYKSEFGHDIADHSVTLVNGDAVYVDINEDGIINDDDKIAMGYTNVPEYVFGMNTGFEWNGFDFSMQWTGAWNTSRMLQETLREPLGDTNNKGLLLYQFEDRWTEETAATAKLPRASITSKANNIVDSDLYLVNASYLRLKSLEIGYNFDIPLMDKIKLNSLRVYANGYNLLTFDVLKITDPESRTSDRPNYPLTRVFTVGLKLGF
jgi:TonB-linked SusC/RagA family outer membrane protein